MSLPAGLLPRLLTRREAVRAGHLVDTSACAAFLGFRYPAALSKAVWDEVVGEPDAATTRAERDAAAGRLQRLWSDARSALKTLQAQGGTSARVAFRTRSASGRPVGVELVLSRDGTDLVLTLYLGGEA